MGELLKRACLPSDSHSLTHTTQTHWSPCAQALSDVTLIGHGASNVVITDIFAGYNATVRVDDGNIIGVVAAVGVEYQLDLQSNGKGGIFLSNFIMGSGALATLTTTEGSIKIAAMTANNLFINTNSGEVNLYEVRPLPSLPLARSEWVAQVTPTVVFVPSRCLLGCPRSPSSMCRTLCPS